MANFENIASAAVETLSCDELADRVRVALLAGATPSTLDEIQKVAKGGLFGAKIYDYQTKYRLYIGKFNGKKVAYLYDDNEKKVYQTTDTKGFYSKIEFMVSREKAYPTRRQ